MLMRDQLFFTHTKPFAKKIVFLPHRNLKNHLMVRFVADKAIKVVLGITFQELGDGIQSLFQMVSDKAFHFFSLNLLSLHIESLLDEEQLSFAPALASEFIKFGKFGGPSLRGWQKELWDKAFKKWSLPYRLLLESPLHRPRDSAEVHLFNFPFLPRIYHLFFARLSSFFPVHYYQFSPCREFWSDLVTEREREYLIKKDPQIISYLDRGNSLLTNLGKLSRETFRIFEEEEFPLDEHYIPKQDCTTLAQLQNDVLHLRESSVQQDRSISLFSASSKLRELEILYQILLQKKTLPSSVQVFAPKISDYAPLIEHVFGKEESPFDFFIYDLPTHSFIEGLLQLFSLDRFEPKAVFQFFSTPYFSSLTPKETQIFRSWINKGEVKWGVDLEHRQHLLPKCLEKSASGTWEQAFTHLINNLIFLPESPSPWDLPYLDFSDAQLLGKCIVLIRSLRKDLDFISSAQLTLSEWSEQVYILFERYFTIPDEKRHLYQSFEKKVQMLCELGKSNRALYSLSSIKRYFSSLLKEEGGVRLSKQLNAIIFRSLKPGSVLSSKIIALIGMDEESFPRPYAPSSLSLLDKTSDFCPHPVDEDRYLFLETLLSAQKTLIFSYQNINRKDGKQQFPSSLIQELNLKEDTYPLFPFHHSYFSKSAPYSKRYFEMAKHFYAPKESKPFIPEFMIPTPLPVPTKEPIEIQVRQLVCFAKHPIRFYCNHILNLYFSYDNKVDEEFQLSPYKRVQIYKQTFHEADLRGHVPLGRFKEVAKECVEEISPLDPVEIDLVLENFHLIGSLESLSFDSKDFLTRIKTYPLYLLQTGQYTPLLRYLHYFHVAMQTPSPFHPYLAHSLLKGCSCDLEKKLKKLPPDPYLQAAFVDVDPNVIFNTWSPLLYTTFKELL